jgi:hypothetical protein
MTLTIELSPDQEARLTAFARHQGLEPAELARKLLAERLPLLGRNRESMADRKHFYFTATPQEWEAAMNELAAGGENFPVLPDEAFDRENLYEDRL